MILKKLSIIFKISLLLLTVSAASLISYFVISKKLSQINASQNTINLIQISEKNLLNILILTEKRKNDEQNAAAELEEKAQLYNNSLHLLKNGGTYLPETDAIEIQAVSEEILPVFSELEKEWNICKQQIEIIVNEPVYNYIKTIIDTASAQNADELLITGKIKNTRLEEAARYLEKNFEVLFNKQNQIADYYNQKIKRAKSINFITIIIIILLFASAVLYSIFLIRQKIIKPIDELAEAVKTVSEGNIHVISEFDDTAEYSSILTELNKIAEQQQKYAEFIKNLKDENFNFKIENQNSENIILASLLQLRDKLSDKEQIELQRKALEKQTQWAAEGQAKFNEILRNSATNLFDLSDNVIQTIVKFLNASQGGLFILNDNSKTNPFLELISAFAYDRKKFFTKKIPVGEGLLGMCALEQNTVWLSKVPNDYIEIESGLGEANPTNLLLIPLKTDIEMLGVIEIASFNKFTKTEVTFLENIARSIASTIATTKITERTAELLKESQKKSEELAQRDNEMTLKIDELRSAQEEAKRNQAEMLSLISAVDRTLLKAELSLRGKITDINELFLNKTNYHREELKNRAFAELLSDNGNIEFETIFDKVHKGETIQTTQIFLTKQKKRFWVISQYTPVRDEKNNIVRILFLGNDITNEKKAEEKNKNLLDETLLKAKELTDKENQMKENLKELSEEKEKSELKEFELQAMIAAIDLNLIKCEFDTNGKIISYNDKFLSALEINSQKAENSHISKYLPVELQNNFEEITNKLINDQIFSGIFSLQNTKSQTLWWIISLTPIKDINKKTIKILLLANDITAQKENEQQIQKQTGELQQQEQIMLMNMEEIMDKSEQLQLEFEKIRERDKKISEKFETNSDKIYYNWLKQITQK